MSDPAKRLAMLEKMTRGGSKDPFHWYALALEYRGAGRTDDALSTFEALRALDAGYVPAFLMCGQMLAEAGRPDEARTWLEAGALAAREKGDQKALGEIEELLETLG